MNCCSNKIKSHIYEGTIHNKKREGYQKNEPLYI